MVTKNGKAFEGLDRLVRLYIVDQRVGAVKQHGLGLVIDIILLGVDNGTPGYVGSQMPMRVELLEIQVIDQDAKVLADPVGGRGTSLGLGSTVPSGPGWGRAFEDFRRLGRRVRPWRQAGH